MYISQMKMRILIFSLYLLSTNYLFSNNIDSLITTLETNISDSAKVSNLVEISSHYIFQNPELGIDYANQAIPLAKKINNLVLLSKSRVALGRNYTQLGNYDQALTILMESLKEDEKNNLIARVSSDCSNIGVVFYYTGNFEKTSFYWNKSLQMSIKVENWIAAANTYNNLGGVAANFRQIDSALFYYKKAKSIFIRMNDSLGMAKSDVNIGSAITDLYDVDGNPEHLRLAIKQYESARAQFKILGDIDTYATATLNMATTYAKLGELDLAENLGRECLEIYDKAKNKESLRESYEAISIIFAGKGEYKSAYHYLDTNRILAAEMFNTSSQESMAEMETKYQTKKKEQQNKLLQKDIERKQVVQYAMGGGILTLVLIAILIFYQFRAKKKANKLLNEQNDEIKSQNEEILSQRDQIETQNTQLAKKNKHIMSSIEYARRIQEAILPSDELIIGNLPESFVYYQPKDIVSGDFYWMEAIDSKVFWAAVDCTGHGVPGAFMSILGANGLKKVVVERKIHKPSEILDHLTDHVVNSITATKEGEEVKDGMDIAICCWDRSTNILEFAGAYNPMYLIRDGEMIITKATKRPVGRFKRRNLPDFENHTMEVKKGDCIYIFSDGFPDQFGGDDGMKYTYRKMRDKIMEIHQEPMEDQHGILMNEFIKWKGKEEQLDDICIFGVRI